MKIRHECYGIRWDINTTKANTTVDISCPNQDKANMILDMIYNIGLYILDTEWQSQYNKYVVYDEEPFCTEGFNIVYKIDATHRYTDFVLWRIFEDYLPKIEQLEKSLEIPWTTSTPKFKGFQQNTQERKHKKENK